MDSDDGLTKRGLNPYTNQWDILATRATAKQAWIPSPPFDEVDEDGHQQSIVRLQHTPAGGFARVIKLKNGRFKQVQMV